MFRDYKVAYLRRHVKIREAVPLSFLRQTVSYLLSQSARKIPHAAGIIHLDVTPVIEYAQATSSKQTEPGDEQALLRQAVRRNFSAFFLKAIAHALYHAPCLNGFLEYSWLRNGGTFYKAEDIHLSFTVHTKFGVLRPIVRNPHLKDLETVANETRELTRRARRTDPEVLYRKAAWVYTKAALRELDFRGLPGLWMWIRSSLFRRTKPDPELAKVPDDQKLRVEDVLGATFTLANIGMMLPAHQTVTVIIPPEVAMIGLGDLHLEPRVVEGKIVPRWVITLCGTMDHRAYDAGEAFPFYDHLQRYIDNPALIYEWQPGHPI